ncbi:Phosphatidic acid phosphohydrolase 2 isoform 3 [Hibiscus syriacus]|uniref:phosphatidate phosphatase n=1 Tax=Hibiscus syriacus TaxID=106335 RepID=A0A6A2YW41_HIBSY|nr:Phosphatidic acid phosphohydrolase 2 isoform 3 [Hibiscus syriacus]
MYAVGRLGSYISRGVYTVSGPFHPFGGAVDIIVVEQPDGSFKSSPCYVRFGKFQGVLKSREKVVSISVNGIEANFHMFLDHKGEAYFLREVDGQEGESDGVPFPSGSETDEPMPADRMPMKSKSFNYVADKSNSVGEVDVSNGKILARTTSRRSRIFGFFGRRSMTKENGYQEGSDGAGNEVSSHSGLENLEYSVEEASIRVSRVSTKQQIVETLSLGEGFTKDKCKVIANISGSIDNLSVGNSDHNENEMGSVSGTSGPDMQIWGNSNKEVVPESLQSFVYPETSEYSVITLDGSDEQTLQTLSISDEGNGKIHVHAETLVATTELVPEVTDLKQKEDMELDSEGILTVLESCSQMVSMDPEIGLEEMKLLSFHTTSTISDSAIKLKMIKIPRVMIAVMIMTRREENSSNDLEYSVGKSRSNPISISRNHRLAGANDGLQVESLPNMWSPDVNFDANSHLPVSHSLDSNSETMKWTSIRKDDSSHIGSDADEEQPLEDERSSSEESETSGKPKILLIILLSLLKVTCIMLSAEISLCKHLLFEGMGAEAACQVFDAEKLDSKKFSSLGPAVVKNDKLVVRVGGCYFTWDEAAPIILGMVTFGSEEIFEPKGMIPVDRVEKSIEGDPSKDVSRSGSWRLWPFSLKRSRSRNAVQPAPAETRGFDAENAADITVASNDDKHMLKPNQVKKMIRAITPTSEQLAALNIKDGMNHITFTFSTPMLGKQQVDARIYLWKWNLV